MMRDDVNIEEIHEEILSPVIIMNSQNVKAVIFYLETTGLRHDSDIGQITAVSTVNDEILNLYAIPTKQISEEVSEVTKITVQTRQLCYDNTPVYCTPREKVSTNFVDFVNKSGEDVLLVGHNIKSFYLS